MRTTTWMVGLSVVGAVLVACSGGDVGTDGRESGEDGRINPSDPSGKPGDETASGAAAPGSERAPRGVGVATTGSPILEILPAARLADIRSRLPSVSDPALADILSSAATIWYDKTAIIPGYQDSFGDNVIAPIGFRPNTIDPGMINLAVPGGHGWLFAKKGVFHFPFAVTGGPDDAPNAFVVDFWSPPVDAHGKPLPAVWWRRDPNANTHKYVWSFPVGTTFGEVLFLKAPSGESYVYEIRTRTRELGQWRVDAFRPFPRATDLGVALAAAQRANPAWQASSIVSALTSHVAGATLVPATLKAAGFVKYVAPAASAGQSPFPPEVGAKDELPAFGDPALVAKLLTETTFTSARGVAWKEHGGLRTWAPTTSETFSIVPKAYKGGFLEVNEVSCARCHQDAGRPFKDWFPGVLAYGELWGEDEIFSWHPFEASKFVKPDGAVANFNYDNRAMRADFVNAGLIEKLDTAKHSPTVYAEIPRVWRNFKY